MATKEETISDWFDANIAIPFPGTHVLCFSNSPRTLDWVEPYFMAEFDPSCNCWFKVRPETKMWNDWENFTEVAYWLPLNKLPCLPPKPGKKTVNQLKQTGGADGD